MVGLVFDRVYLPGSGIVIKGEILNVNVVVCDAFEEEYKKGMIKVAIEVLNKNEEVIFR